MLSGSLSVEFFVYIHDVIFIQCSLLRNKYDDDDIACDIGLTHKLKKK